MSLVHTRGAGCRCPDLLSQLTCGFHGDGPRGICITLEVSPCCMILDRSAHMTDCSSCAPHLVHSSQQGNTLVYLQAPVISDCI